MHNYGNYKAYLAVLFCSVCSLLPLRPTFLPSAPHVVPVTQKDFGSPLWHSCFLTEQQLAQLKSDEHAHTSGSLTLPSRCSCSVLTVSLSLVSCSWVALRSCWSLVAAWPRSLDSFFSFSRRSCYDSTSKLLGCTEQEIGHNMESSRVYY